MRFIRRGKPILRCAAIASAGTIHSLSTGAKHNFVCPIAPRSTVSPKVSTSHCREISPARVTRIAITGGPCAGKSSALAYLTKQLKQHGFDVYVAPELATILCLGGTSWTEDETYRIEYLTAQCLLQLQMESTFTRIAAATGRPSVLICDRGVFDNKSFLKDEVWAKVLKGLGEQSEWAILRQYDGVVHMVTAAQGAEAYYKHGWTVDDLGKNVFRRETAEEAREQDKLLMAAWRGHSCVKVIGNGGGGFDAKLHSTSAAVLEIVVANRKQPA